MSNENMYYYDYYMGGGVKRYCLFYYYNFDTRAVLFTLLYITHINLQVTQVAYQCEYLLLFMFCYFIV